MTEYFTTVDALSSMKATDLAAEKGRAHAQDDYPKLQATGDVEHHDISEMSREEQEAYGEAWGREIARLQQKAADRKWN